MAKLKHTFQRIVAAAAAAAGFFLCPQGEKEGADCGQCLRRQRVKLQWFAIANGTH